MSQDKSAASNNWVDCMCKKIGDICGTAKHCGIPGVIEAIEKKDCAKVVSLLIQGGACAVAPGALLGAIVAAFFICSFGVSTSKEAEEALVKEIQKAVETSNSIKLT